MFRGMTLKVRAATIVDAPAIAEIHVRAWQSAYAGIVDAGYLASLSVADRTVTWTEGLRAGHMPDGGYIFVAEVDEQVAGWMTCGPSRDADAAATVGELHGIYVHPDRQDQGVGTALMAKCLDELRRQGFTRATLLVLTLNRSARRWYESHGWIFDGTEISFVLNGQELAEMRYARML